MIKGNPVPLPKGRNLFFKRRKNKTSNSAGTTYIEVEISRVWDSERGFSRPKSVLIGKLCNDREGWMIPNANYFEVFPDVQTSQDALMDDMPLTRGIATEVKSADESSNTVATAKDNVQGTATKAKVKAKAESKAQDGTESKAQDGAESKAQDGAESKAQGTATKAKAKAKAESKAQDVVEDKAQGTATKAKAEAKAESKAQDGAESKAQGTATKAKAKAKAESKDQDEAGGKAQDGAESKAQGGVESQALVLDKSNVLRIAAKLKGVPVPLPKGRNLYFKRRKNKTSNSAGTTYIEAELSRVWDAERGFSRPKSVLIGKLCNDREGWMIPNANFFEVYPDVTASLIAQMGEQSLTPNGDIEAKDQTQDESKAQGTATKAKAKTKAKSKAQEDAAKAESKA